MVNFRGPSPKLLQVRACLLIRGVCERVLVCWGNVQLREVIIYWGTLFYVTSLWESIKK